VLPVFLVLFIAGVGLWFVMLKRYGLFSRATLPPTDANPTLEPKSKVELIGS
jgi:hypothetical protein